MVLTLKLDELLLNNMYCVLLQFYSPKTLKQVFLNVNRNMSKVIFSNVRYSRIVLL